MLQRDFSEEGRQVRPSLGQQVCVIIPVFNNEESIQAVVDGVLQFTRHIIVVNDGSTDGTLPRLTSFTDICILSFQTNKGKGAALAAGFRKATIMGYTHAITIDADGQHFADDLPVFYEAAFEFPDTLFIGSRNLSSAPGRSSFGNRFSNFWFWVETGVRLVDSQSGYRLYPLAPLAGLRFYTNKYEFEIEVPVRLNWRGVPVRNIPVKVYYPPPAVRVSHFRPFRDFLRISLLNAGLTLLALFWVHPKRLFIALFQKEKRKYLWEEYVVARHESNVLKAASIGFGVFMGIFPVWGFQLAIGIPLALYFKLNKPLFLLAANVSFFPMTPVIWALSLLTGKLLLGYRNWHFNVGHWHLQDFKEAGAAFFLGGAVLALLAGLLFFLVAFLLLVGFRKQENK
ncbi:MAG TPA: DUF2062 domain-containing protein [Edaphocola sp.]|nr:DUF2062 domain-containing protein [Edaphocola sp.]